MSDTRPDFLDDISALHGPKFSDRELKEALVWIETLLAERFRKVAKENEDSDEFGEEARRLLQYQKHLHRTAEITQELLED